MGKSLRQCLNALEKMGRKALQPYMKRDYRGVFRYHPPTIPRNIAFILRNHCLTHGEPWPYEDVYPGLRHDIPPPISRKKDERARLAREQRLAKIRENMKDMDQKIAAYRESLKVKNVSLLDQLTMRKKQIRMKYMRPQQQ